MRWLFAAALLLFGAAHAFAAPLHHYTFTNGAAVFDSVGTDDGVLMNGASIAADYLALDGNDDIVQFSTKLVPSGGDFTLAFFAQESAVNSGYAEIISHGFSSGSGFYVGYDPSHNIRVGDSWLSTGIAFPTDGLWHHIAVVNEATDAHLYIDGLLALSKGGPLLVTSSGTDTRLGNQFDFHSEFFAGNVDELWVFDDALSGGDIALLAGVPEPGGLALTAVSLFGLVIGWKRRRLK